MPTAILTIPTPCHESWQQMTPTATGWHCAACQKVVVDFTRFTDAELLAYLRQHAGQATCGRFQAGQLERPLRPIIATNTVSRWRAWLAAAVAVWGLREATAPAARAQEPVEQWAKASRPTAATLEEVAEPAITLRGMVLDSLSGEPLPGATILVTGTQIGVSSTIDGNFELTVPASTHHLTVSAIGFETRQLIVSHSPTQFTNIMLSPSITGMLVGGYSYYPWYTPRGLWQRLKRPFQRLTGKEY